MAKTSTVVLTTLLVGALIVGAAIGGVAFANNYHVNLPWDQTSSSSSNTGTASSDSQTTSIEPVKTDDQTVDGIQIEATARSSDSISLTPLETGVNSHGYGYAKYSYFVSPRGTSSQKIKISASTLASSDQGIRIQDICTASINSDSQTFELVFKKDFSSPITFSIVSTEDSSKTAVVEVNCIQRFMGFISGGAKRIFRYVVEDGSATKALPWYLNSQPSFISAFSSYSNSAPVTYVALDDYTEGFSSTYTLEVTKGAYFTFSKPSSMKLRIIEKPGISSNYHGYLQAVYVSKEYMNNSSDISSFSSKAGTTWGESALGEVNEMIGNLSGESRTYLRNAKEGIKYVGLEGDMTVTVTVTKNGSDWQSKTFTETLGIYVPAEEIEFAIDPTGVKPEISGLEF